MNQQEYARLEKVIEAQEVSKCLKASRNNFTPDASGFTGLFYKVFWKLLSSLVTRAINKTYERKYSSSLCKS